MRDSSAVIVQPPVTGWPARARTLPAIAHETRLALGLPAARAVIMSGHQAELWHPGIAAKAFAMTHIAHACAGASAWVHVDQDANDPTRIAYPTRDLRMGTWAVSSQTASAKASLPATGSRPALREASVVPADVHPSVKTSYDRMREAILRRADTASLAAQFAELAFEPLSGLAQVDVPFMATQLASTPAFAEAVALMRADPHACAETYNAAAAGVPAARLRALHISEQRVELPLWRVRTGMARLPVFASDLDRIPAHELAPRALLMTALLRACACEVFIHGTGGGVYDQATDAWWHAWMQRCRGSLRELSLAPTAVVTATRRLTFPGAHVPEPEAIDHTVWLAHRALHDPHAAGDDTLITRKQELVAAIASAPRRSGERRALYRQMHSHIAQMRTQRQSHIENLAKAAANAVASREVAAVVHARTWPCAVYPRGVLEELSYTIGRAIAM